MRRRVANHIIDSLDMRVAVIGDLALMRNRKYGLLCSRRCPANTILEAYELFRTWADDPGVTVISGFHSPVEKECLRLLLEGEANMIFCPAREIESMRLPKNWGNALDEGRMLILSPFAEKRADRSAICRRNQIVADLADELCVPYASPDGNLAQLRLTGPLSLGDAAE